MGNKCRKLDIYIYRNKFIAVKCSLTMAFFEKKCLHFAIKRVRLCTINYGSDGALSILFTYKNEKRSNLTFEQLCDFA